ncbi:hypothetical protein [Streptomyces sp. IMTB 2501]
MSTNPFTDSHVIHAVALIALTAARAGTARGLGHLRVRLPVVRDRTWLR